MRRRWRAVCGVALLFTPVILTRVSYFAYARRLVAKVMGRFPGETSCLSLSWR